MAQRRDSMSSSSAASECGNNDDGLPNNKSRPLILITDSNSPRSSSQLEENERELRFGVEEEEQVEEIDGISYRIVAAVTKPAKVQRGKITVTGKQSNNNDNNNVNQTSSVIMELDDNEQGKQRRGSANKHKQTSQVNQLDSGAAATAGLHKVSSMQRGFNSVRRKSSAFVSNLLQLTSNEDSSSNQPIRQRRLSIYEMTKTPPPETSLEIYLSDRRRSSTVSAKQIQQQLEQQSTFETNYCQRQQYFKDLNQKLLNQDKKLLNVVANRGQIHRHSVDIAQLPLHSAQAQATKTQQQPLNSSKITEDNLDKSNELIDSINQSVTIEAKQDEELERANKDLERASSRLSAIRANRSLMEHRGSIVSRGERHKKSRIIIRKFQKLDQSLLSSTPAPDVKIGQRVAYKEYYGNEFGTIRWIGRVPQICPDWTVGVEFDNAIGEGDGSLNGRRYFIAKDCFAKFLPLENVALVDQHVGRPEPGTMISVMSAAVRPGQMISIQRVSTVHVQHCFLNAPHRIPGADILAVNTRLHCQCPNCGPCAHVIKPPRTQRLARGSKNATHMCQFSTYTCCGMESQEEATCTYTGNKVMSLPPPTGSSLSGLPPIGNSWIEGAGYLTNLQAQQSKSMPEEYKLGSAPEDIINPNNARRLSRSGSRRNREKRNDHRSHQDNRTTARFANNTPPINFDNKIETGTGDVGVTCEPDPNFMDKNVCNILDYNNHPEQAYFTKQLDPKVDQLALACPDKASYEEYNNWNPNEKNLPKSPKIVYRDSIENRYLFPTDDLIDSTLEADLENLSQARYGHSTSSRLNGSRNIFKSLRSLVSCLSAQSNHSEFGRRSENTIEFSEHVAKGIKNKSIPIFKSDDVCAQSNSGLEKEKGDLHSNGSFALACEHRPAANNHQVLNRHISSSSDCGFSSASQNSINFQSYTNYSPITSAEDERRTKLIYKRIIARLLSSTSVSSEDLHRLRRVLFEPHFENFCMHNGINQPSLNTNFSAAESDQIISDIIQKAYLDHDKGHDNLQKTSTSSCHATNYHMSKTALELDEFEELYAYSKCQKTIMGGCNTMQTASPREIPHGCPRSLLKSPIDGSLTSDTSNTISSYDSICGNTNPGDSHSNNLDVKKRDKTKSDEKQNPDTTAGLPKAFELKLSLSFNTDSKVQPNTTLSSCELIDCTTNNINQDDTSKSLNNLINSNFNINITSKQKDEPSANSIKVVPEMKNVNVIIDHQNQINSEPEARLHNEEKSTATILDTNLNRI